MAKKPAADQGMPILHVKWRDAVKNQGWLTDLDWLRADIHQCDSVGILLDDGHKEHITLAMSIGETCVADVMKIPRAMIVSTETLGYVSGAHIDWSKLK